MSKQTHAPTLTPPSRSPADRIVDEFFYHPGGGPGEPGRYRDTSAERHDLVRQLDQLTGLPELIRLALRVAEQDHELADQAREALRRAGYR